MYFSTFIFANFIGELFTLVHSALTSLMLTNTSLDFKNVINVEINIDYTQKMLGCFMSNIKIYISCQILKNKFNRWLFFLLHFNPNGRVCPYLTVETIF